MESCLIEMQEALINLHLDMLHVCQLFITKNNATLKNFLFVSNGIPSSGWEKAQIKFVEKNR